MAQLGFADMEEVTGRGSAMVVHGGTTLGDLPMTGYGLVALPPADGRLVVLRIFGKAPRPQRLYRATIGRFSASTAKPLASLTLDDLQAFTTSLGGLAATTCTVMLATVNSHLSIGNRIGILPLNVGAALRIMAPPDDLNERIQTDPEVHRPVPAPVSVGRTYTALVARGSHTCGLVTGGAAYCWGLNGSGQLGDGTSGVNEFDSSANRLVPVAVNRRV